MNTSRLLRHLSESWSQIGRLGRIVAFSLPIFVIAGCNQPAAPERAEGRPGEESTIASVPEVPEVPEVPKH